MTVRTIPPPVVKACTKCGLVKPLGSFPRAKRNKNGRHSWCKDCHRASTARLREDPAYRQRDIARVRAAEAAMRRLRDNHRDEYDQLYADELAKRGLS